LPLVYCARARTKGRREEERCRPGEIEIGHRNEKKKNKIIIIRARPRFSPCSTQGT